MVLRFTDATTGHTTHLPVAYIAYVVTLADGSGLIYPTFHPGTMLTKIKVAKPIVDALTAYHAARAAGLAPEWKGPSIFEAVFGKHW